MLDEFENYAKQAMQELPDEFRGKLDNVDVFIEDYPTEVQLYKLRLRHGHSLLGLYEGIPQTKRGIHYGIGGVLPDKITLFRFAILSMARSEAHLISLIKDTLYHEIGHHFGMSEKQLRDAQKNKF